MDSVFWNNRDSLLSHTRIHTYNILHHTRLTKQKKHAHKMTAKKLLDTMTAKSFRF